jgi:MFS family permease
MFLTTASPSQRRALIAASLGWMLDSMDVMLYAMVLPSVARDLHLSSALSGAMMSATLLSAAAGGLFFGWFADRLGRTRALNASLLIYSVATALWIHRHAPAPAQPPPLQLFAQSPTPYTAELNASAKSYDPKL